MLRESSATRWSEIDADRVEAFLRRRRETHGIGARTSNSYLHAARQFCRWCVTHGWAAADPLRRIQEADVKRDRRRVRRALDVGELARLLIATSRGAVAGGMSGSERALLYTLVTETGLRRSEVVQLRVADVSSDAQGHPALRARFETSKNSAEKLMPLRKETAARLTSLVRGRPPWSRAFSMPTWWRAAETLRIDLAAADIPYVDAAGRVHDFHALRVTFGSNLARAGLPLQVAQKLMRHSTPTLTSNVYTVLTVDDERRAVESLPSFPVPDAVPDSEYRRIAVHLT